MRMTARNLVEHALAPAADNEMFLQPLRLSRRQCAFEVLSDELHEEVAWEVVRGRGHDATL